MSTSISDTGFMPFVPFEPRSDHQEETESINSSSDSSLEASTNATSSNIVGAGRLIGQGYSRAGRALENGIAKAVRSIRHRRDESTQRPDTTPPVEAQNVTFELQMMNNNNQGEGRRRGSAPTSVSGTSIWRAFSFYTVTSDETATDLPGTGRVIGKLYAAGGRAIESYLNKRAIKAGHGPDACGKLIRQSIIGEPYPDELLLYLHFKARNMRRDLLDGAELVMFDECIRLLRYVKSDVTSTHNRAMQLISELAVEDRYIHTVLNGLRASEILEDVRKRQLKLHNIDSDWFLPYCRKAILSLQGNEVNSTMFRHLRTGDKFSNLPVDLIYSTLEKYFHDPEQSFLAIRYMRRLAVGAEGLGLLPVAVASVIFGRIADLVFSLPHIVEWDCIDDIFRRSITYSLSYVEERGPFSKECLTIWNKVLVCILTNPHRLPLTIELITAKTNIYKLLDTSDEANQRARELFIKNNFRFPNGSSLGNDSVRAAITLPWLLLGLKNSALSIPAGEGENNGILSRHENFQAFSQTYSHVELERIRNHLSAGPDVVTSEIFGLRDTNWRSPPGQFHGVAKEPRLTILCDLLIGFLKTPDTQVQSRTLKWVHLVLLLDRYCRKAMRQAMKRFLSDPDPDPNVAGNLHLLLLKPKPTNPDALRGGFPDRWALRHKLPGGRIHIQSALYSDYPDPCPICAKGGQDSQSVTSKMCAEIFFAPREHVLLLDVRPGRVFSSFGHKPILANITDTGEKEYIATVMYANGERSAKGVLFHSFGVVTEGAATIEYLDESGARHTTDHFWVLVLRFDESDGVEQKLLHVHGEASDVSGSCYWKPEFRGHNSSSEDTIAMSSLG